MGKTMMGEDEGDENAKAEAGSPGGIIVETLLNMNTVSALTLEEERFKLLEEVLHDSSGNYLREGLHEGALSGLSMFVQQWIQALQFWFGGWLMFKNPELYSFRDFLSAMFTIMFGLFSLGAAFQDVSDRKEVEKSISRILYLLDKPSEIDPLSEEGKTIDYNKKAKMKKKKSEKKAKKEKRASSLKNMEGEHEDFHEVDDDGAKKSSSSLKKSSSSLKKKKIKTLYEETSR